MCIRLTNELLNSVDGLLVRHELRVDCVLSNQFHGLCRYAREAQRRRNTAERAKHKDQRTCLVQKTTLATWLSLFTFTVWPRKCV